MPDLKKQAEDLGITIDNRWSDDTLKQKIADAKEAQASASRDVGNPDGATSNVAPVDTSDARELPNIGVMRSESSQEIREREAGAGLAPAPYPGDPRESHAAAAALAQQTTGRPPELQTTGMSTGNDRTTPIRLLYDWWDGQGIRHEHGEVIDVPMNEAIKLIGEAKAERADPLLGQAR